MDRGTRATSPQSFALPASYPPSRHPAIPPSRHPASIHPFQPSRQSIHPAIPFKLSCSSHPLHPPIDASTRTTTIPHTIPSIIDSHHPEEVTQRRPLLTLRIIKLELIPRLRRPRTTPLIVCVTSPSKSGGEIWYDEMHERWVRSVYGGGVYVGRVCVVCVCVCVCADARVSKQRGGLLSSTHLRIIHVHNSSY